MISFDLRVVNMLNAAVTSSGVNTTAIDLRNTVGNLFVNVSSRASGTNSMAVALEHSEDNSSFAAVPASAIWDAVTGDVATFTTVTTAAVNETVVVNRQQCKRYVRVALSGTTLTHEVSVVGVVQPQMSEYAAG